MRSRLDLELVRRGLVDTRQEAQRLISESAVLVEGVIADKAARKVSKAENLRILGPKPKYVSRAGQKLEKALQNFEIDPTGFVCVDVGSSTGGFTDCLLQSGASKVYSVDVGTNQLHEKIRSDDRVEVFEQTDIRKFELENCVDLVVCDVSFISLKLVLENMKSFIDNSGTIIVLIKPQFEAGRSEVSKGSGVISDPEIWKRVINEVTAFADSIGLYLFGLEVSPVQGASGNVEFLAGMRSSNSLGTSVQISDLIDAVINDIEVN